MPYQFLDPKEQLQKISSGSVDLIQSKELLKKLKEKRPLIVKAGFDPSRPDIHIGHSILINKLREFQELGHKIYIIVGDFTACIGDPSGQNQTRPLLSQKEAHKNASTYIDQITYKNFNNPESLDTKTHHLFNYLKRLDARKTKILYNSKWLNKISLQKFIMDITSHLTVARQLERNDFSKRYQAQKPIGLHEFYYPILQAYDSVEIKADIELGGTDQLFNLLLGRELQEHYHQDPQCILTLPLLEGIDGVQKMSKSLGNDISFKDSPNNIFGKIMKISDELLITYWQRLTGGHCNVQFAKQIQDKSLNPKKEKELLAWAVVYSLYGMKAAQQAKDEFLRIFSNKGLPDYIPEKVLPASKNIWICHLIKEVGLSSSTSEARRQVLAGAIKKEGEKIKDVQQKIDLHSGDSFLLSSGKRHFIKVKVS